MKDKRNILYNINNTFNDLLIKYIIYVIYLYLNDFSV